MSLKLYCVFGAEAIALMKGNRGKLAAQAGHAYLHSWWDSAKRFPEHADTYSNSQMAFKIALVAPTEDVLRQLEELYKDRCGVSLVTDAGLTVFEKPTTTCIGIGPIDPDDREEILKSLKPLI